MNRCPMLARSVCLCAAVWLLAFASSARADVGSDDYNVAVKLYQASRWPLAVKQFEEFLTRYPQHEKAPLAKFYLGLTHINQENYKAAREVLRSFAKIYPDNANLPQARYRIAECSYLLDDLPAAQPELQEFIDKHPQDPLADRALPYLGDVQLRRGQAAPALATFDRVLNDFPKSPLIDDARFGRGRALAALKRDDEAIQQYQQLADEKSNSRAVEARFQIGALQFETKHFAEAAAAYQALLRDFPTSPLGASARLNAGYALFQDGKFAAAAQQFAESQKDPGNFVTAGYWQGLSLKSQGDSERAAAVLAKVAEEAGDSSLAESIQFQRAICARQLGDAATARDLFIKGSQRWPKGEYADDSLHAAAELAVEAGDLPAAAQLLDRFAREFPGSGLRLHYELLQGRIDLAKGSAAEKELAALANANQPPNPAINEHFRRAAERFERVLHESMVERTQLLARYYLALARQLQGQQDEALKTIEPVVQVVLRDGPKSEFGESLVVQFDSQFTQKQFEPAQVAAAKYLELYPQGRQVPRALSMIALSAAHRGEKEASAAAVERLVKDYRTSSVTPTTLLQLAELAEQKMDWPTSAKHYTSLIGVSEGTDNQAFALRGLAWSRFKLKEFAAAAEYFGRVVREFPKHKLVSECAYYQAESLREAGELEPAAAAFAEVLEQFGPAQPAAPGAEQQPPLIYAYRAGLQRARALRVLKQIPEADQAYESVLEKFPQPKTLDGLLNEWALLNYEAGNFERADALFLRLIKEVPDSEWADNARLSLAESDLIADRRDDAKNAFEKLLAADTSDAEVKERALYQLIVLALDQQRWNDLRALTQRMAQEFPNSPHAAYAAYSAAEEVLSSAKIKEEDLAAARKHLQEVIQSAPEELPPDAWQGRAWVLLAETYFREKNYDEVRKIAADFRTSQPKSIYGYQVEEVIGRSYKQEANFPEALKAFERVLIDPNAFRTETAAKSQFLIAETRFLEQRYEDAFLAYQKVYASYDFPYWQAAALLQSGKCDELLSEWKEAVKSYDLLIKEFPKSEFAEEARQRLEVAKKKAGG